MTDEFLLRINIPPGLEEDFVDELLGMPGLRGYQSYPTRGHGQVGAMTVAEQVAGRRERIQFEVVLSEEQVDPLLQRLGEAFPIRDVIWWLLPILRSGRLSDRDD